MNKSVLFTFDTTLSKLDLNTNTFNNSMKAYLYYLLGIYSYKEALTKFSLKLIKKAFKDTLYSFTISDIHYCKTSFRKYARGEYVSINAIDKCYLDNFKKPKNIKVYRYPHINDVYEDMKGPIYHNMNNLHKTSKKSFKETFSKRDLYSIMNIKILELYKLYIHGYNTVLDPKAFYSILHNSINALKIDLIRRVNASKRSAPMASVDVYEIEIFDNICYLDRTLWSPSPEHALMYKEEIINSNLSQIEKLKLINNDISLEDASWI